MISAPIQADARVGAQIECFIEKLETMTARLVLSTSGLYPRVEHITQAFKTTEIVRGTLQQKRIKGGTWS